MTTRDELMAAIDGCREEYELARERWASVQGILLEGALEQEGVTATTCNTDGCEVEVPRREWKRRYCSNACRQKAYRARMAG